MKITTFVAVALVVAGPISLATISSAQQPADGQPQSEQGRNGMAPSPGPNTSRPSGAGESDGAASDGTPSRLSGPSTPDHAWYGNDPLKSGSGSPSKGSR